MARFFLAAFLATILGGCSQFPLLPTISAPAEGIEVHFSHGREGKVDFSINGEPALPVHIRITGPGPGFWWAVGHKSPKLVTSGFDQKTGFPMSEWEASGDFVLFMDGSSIPELRQQFLSTIFTAADRNGNTIEVFPIIE